MPAKILRKSQREQKKSSATRSLSGAAADMLNANIIARDLGLSDKSELTGKGGGPIKIQSARDLTDDELAAIAATSGK